MRQIKNLLRTDGHGSPRVREDMDIESGPTDFMLTESLLYTTSN